MHDLEAQAAMRIEQIGTREMLERVTQWNEEVNRVYNALISTFATRNPAWNTMPITRVLQPAAAYGQFVDEHGVAKPERETGYIDQGFPLFRYELAMQVSYEALQKITVEEYSRQLNRIERGDMTTTMRLFWFTIFYATNWTFVSTEDEFPDIAVKTFANSDAELYVVRGEDDPQTATHYTGQAAAISDAADPFPDAKETLTSYGGTNPNDLVVCFVGDATNVDNIRSLSGFIPIDRTNAISWANTVSLTDPSADRFLGIGDTVLGEHEDGVVVIRKRDLPANYLVFFNLSAGMPVGIREDEVTSLQGLFNIDSVENSGNSLLRRFRRKIGFAPVNRTGVLVHRIGNGTYAAPSPYDVMPG
jgi:hypothetical protein